MGNKTRLERLLDETAPKYHPTTASLLSGALARDDEARHAGIRAFETGATRDTETGKYDYEGFLSPQVVWRFAEYMHKHREQSDGELRDSDNWQKGMPRDVYIKSMFRHFMDVWMIHRGFDGAREDEDVDMQEALCALMFNVMGYLFEEMNGR